MPKRKSTTNKGKKSQRPLPVPNNRNIIVDLTIDDEEPQPKPAPPKLGPKSRKRTRSGSKQQQESTCEFQLPDAKRSKYYNGECTLCGEELGTAGGVCSTSCGHMFCEECLLDHLRISVRCPKCKKSLKATRPYHPLYLN